MTEWPGTRLIGGGIARRYLFKLTYESLAIFIHSAQRLTDWVNPELPEDLHLLRNNGSTVLGNIAQEDDAWLELDQDEFGRLCSTTPHWTRSLLSEKDG